MRKTRCGPSSSPSRRRTSRNAAASFFKFSISSAARSQCIGRGAQLTILAFLLRLIELRLIHSLVVLSEELAKQVAFSPHNTVNGLAGSGANGAHGERLGSRLVDTVVALSLIVNDGRRLSKVSSRSRLNKRDVGSLTKLVDVPPRIWRQLTRAPQLYPPMLSRAFITRPNLEIHSMSFDASFTLP